MTNKGIVLFGYSGHAYVVCDVFFSRGLSPIGYYTKEPVDFNPYQLEYYGFEENTDSLERLWDKLYFVAVGNNEIRQKITNRILTYNDNLPCNAIAESSIISKKSIIGYGVLVAPGSIINSSSNVGNGVICNTGSIIEHECEIGEYTHIGPGAILCGNVKIGNNTFVGAGSVIKEGVIIGDNVIIGAGTVVIHDIEDNNIVVGNPQRIIK